MEATVLGRTGLTVTPVGLGLAALGRPAYINLGRSRDLFGERSTEVMEARCHAVLDAAYEYGIRYVDVARSYGHSERFLASWLRARDLAPERLTVGSKWGYAYVGGWRLEAEVHEVKDHSLSALKRQFGESRDLLGSHLHLYQIHSATLDTGVLEDAGVLRELAAIAEAGVAVGLSVSGPRQREALLRALEADVDGSNPFSCVQATFNLLEPSVGDALAEAHATGWGVIVKEALANGRLTASNDDPSFADKRRVLEEMRRAASLDQLAIAWALSHEFVDVVLSGAVTVQQLASNLGALELDRPGDPADLGGVAEAPEDYWGMRKTLPWS